MRWFMIAMTFAVVGNRASIAPALTAVEDQPITIKLNRDSSAKPTFDVSGLPSSELALLAKNAMTREDFSKFFNVYVSNKNADAPPMLGTYRVEKDVLRFEPAFPLEAGITYVAKLSTHRLPGHAAQKRPLIVNEFLIPKLATGPTTTVERIYPSANTLPENQLRFYIHFSSPMRQGEAYQHIRLLDADGKHIEQAFLELDQELWDRDGKRFTLFFNPGRVKKGLQPREELGPVLVLGRTYTLEVDKGWRDANGLPLKESFRKSFKVGPAEEERVQPSAWKIQPPKPTTRDPLTVRFPRPLDHALLHRCLSITNADGVAQTGKIATAEFESSWTWTPDKVWTEGGYFLIVDARLEDRAGNSVAREFEVDVFHPVEGQIKTEHVKIPFTIR